VQTGKLADLIPDTRNANKGTPRGLGMLEESLQRYGAGRSILTDKHGHIIAGNKTAEVAGSVGLEDAIVVKTDGTRLVVVQRTDIDIDSKEGRELAIADNRVGQVSLEWDADTLASFADDGVDLSQFWNEDELAELLNSPDLETDNNYSRKIDIPLYEARGEKPTPSTLVDLTKYQTLIDEIDNADFLTAEERRFLELAAARHLVFSYSSIADFYAHSSAQVQRLMENSALVIIDFNRAIELGYVALTKSIAELVGEENPDD